MFTAYASSSGTSTTGGGWMSWVIIVVMFAALYFLMIRPQNKRDKEARNMRDNLKPGDEIVTIGGIYGKIVRVTEDRVVIMVGSEKVKLEMAKSAISGLADTSASSSSSSKSKPAPEPEDKSKPSPKSIKKLGAKKEAAEETAVQASEDVSETVKEAVQTAEDIAETVKETAEAGEA